MKKYIECDHCHKELSGSDDVYEVRDNAVYGHYCSEKCVAEALTIEYTDAETYIEEAERLGEDDDVFCIND